MTASPPHPLVAFEVSLDCADAAGLAAFWKHAVGYVDAGDAPDGTAWLRDPRRVAPHLALIEVDEPKTVKNRMHIDLAVSGDGTPEQRWQRVVAESQRLQSAGATVVREFTGNWISMADPEGNEFDVC